METRLTLRPGQNGTRKLAERFGKRLVRVRYRYDETLRKRYTTVELIVAESAWTPRSRKPRATRSPDDMVYVRIASSAASNWRKGSSSPEFIEASNIGYSTLDICRQMLASRIGCLHLQVYAFLGGDVPPNTS